MKNSKIKLLLIISIFLISFSQFSCKKEEMAITPTPKEMEAIMAIAKGSFMTSAHVTSGTAALNTEKTMLHFTNFKTDAGPDLNIYLASDISKIKSDFVDLGDIKGIKGDFMYDVPAKTDFAKYKYVVVWCVDFNVNFGYAELKP